MRLIFILLTLSASAQAQKPAPFRIAIDGLSHTHVHWLLGRADDGDLEIVGIAEPNVELATRYLKQYNLPTTLLYASLSEMLDKTHPQAVAAFNPIDEHVETVRQCAPRKVHVMVEKPLAASLGQAKEMERLARQHSIHLLVNYETTWYASNYAAKEKLKSLGPVRKLVAHHGHPGPKAIGVNNEFLVWLTDPVKNGGGALTDFGCYGANLFTWLMDGQRPISVTAVTQHFQPEVYPRVDDEATIILTYPNAQGIIQASWNWPYNRKDIEVYAVKGYLVADRVELKLKPGSDAITSISLDALKSPFHDPFAYLAAVVSGVVKISSTDLSSLENNMIVIQILEASKESARTGKAVYLTR